LNTPWLKTRLCYVITRTPQRTDEQCRRLPSSSLFRLTQLARRGGRPFPCGSRVVVEPHVRSAGANHATGVVLHPTACTIPSEVKSGGMCLAHGFCFDHGCPRRAPIRVAEFANNRTSHHAAQLPGCGGRPFSRRSRVGVEPHFRRAGANHATGVILHPTACTLPSETHVLRN